MQQEDRSLKKLNSIARFLKLSGKFYFLNYNLKLFYDFIINDNEIGTIIKKLLLKHPNYEQEAFEVLSAPQSNLQDYRSKGKITSFEEMVAFCIFYVKAATEMRGGNPVLDKVIGLYDGSGYDKERQDITQFYNDIIEPILIYVELQIQQTQNTLYILQRYKVLCEWYDREFLFNEREVNITQKHLSRYLFDQGFTYSLSETTVPSGKIDNFAIDMGFQDKREFGNLPNAIIAEGKIYDGKASDLQDVRNQVSKRMDDLGFSEGFCVIFNKTPNQINFYISEKENLVGKLIGGFYVIKENNKTSFFLVINLDKSFLNSTKTITEIKAELV